MDWWTCYQEKLSPFLNDKKLSDVGEDPGVHKGLDALFSTSFCPRNRGRNGGIPYQEHFCLILNHEALKALLEDLGGHDWMCHSQPPKFRNMDTGICYWEGLSPFLNDKTLNNMRNDPEPQIVG